jgi:hypothetical protein
MLRRIKSRERCLPDHHRNCIGSNDETNIGDGPSLPRVTSSITPV